MKEFKKEQLKSSSVCLNQQPGGCCLAIFLPIQLPGCFNWKDIEHRFGRATRCFCYKLSPPVWTTHTPMPVYLQPEWELKAQVHICLASSWELSALLLESQKLAERGRLDHHGEYAHNQRVGWALGCCLGRIQQACPFATLLRLHISEVDHDFWSNSFNPYV